MAVDARLRGDLSGAAQHEIAEMTAEAVTPAAADNAVRIRELEVALVAAGILPSLSPVP